jgi:hypothetical protein
MTPNAALLLEAGGFTLMENQSMSTLNNDYSHTVTDFYGRIIEAAQAAIDRGIDPTSQAMIHAICTAVPGASQAEIDEALRRHLD